MRVRLYLRIGLMYCLLLRQRAHHYHTPKPWQLNRVNQSHVCHAHMIGNLHPQQLLHVQMLLLLLLHGDQVTLCLTLQIGV